MTMKKESHKMCDITNMKEDKVELDTILEGLKDELPEFVAAAVAGSDGLTISTLAKDSSVDMSMVGAEFASIVSMVSKAGREINAGKLHSSIFSTDNYHILTSQVGETPFFQIICLRSDGNIGKARYLMGKTEARIKEAIL